jgi:RNA recognition motif-containing protein
MVCSVDCEEKIRTLYCGGLSGRITEPLLFELFLQVVSPIVLVCKSTLTCVVHPYTSSQSGPVEDVVINRAYNCSSFCYGLVKFVHACSVPYAMTLFDKTKLYGQSFSMQMSYTCISCRTATIDRYRPQVRNEFVNRNAGRRILQRGRQMARPYQLRPPCYYDDDDEASYGCLLKKF